MSYANSAASAGTVFANSDRYWERRRTERKNVTDRGPDDSLIITFEHCISGHLRPGRLWTHGTLTAVGGEKTLESCWWSCIVSVGTMDSSAEDLRPCAFTVPNKNRNATAFISVSQCARTEQKIWAYESLNQLWPECVRFKRHSVYWVRNGAQGGTTRRSFMGAPSALMESERQLCTRRSLRLF